MNSFHALIVLLGIAGAAPSADNDTPDEPQNDSTQAPKSDARTVARWSFERDSEPGTWTKRVIEAGPRPPSYPGFSPDNHAAYFEAGSRLMLKDEGTKDAFRFSQGESLTIEAWVRVQELKNGQYAYLIGKGRTGTKGFPEKNQNYALRLKGDAKGAHISFLFASQPGEGWAGEWHRWTSTQSFEPGSLWHHVAISYTFGKPDSMRGFIDSRAVSAWDLGSDRSSAGCRCRWSDDCQRQRRRLTIHLPLARRYSTVRRGTMTPAEIETRLSIRCSSTGDSRSCAGG